MTPARTRKATKAVVTAPIEGEIVDSATTNVDESNLISIGSLQFRMTRPTGDQLSVLAKVARAADRDPANGVRAIEVFFKIIDTCLVDPADGERIEDALIGKDLTIKQLTDAIGVTDDDAESTSTAPRRTRRGR